MVFKLWVVSVSLSKALDNSIKSPRIYLLYSKDSRIWLTNCTIACLVKCSVWKPNSLEYRILLSVKYRVQTIENYPFENVLKAGKHSYCPVVKGYIRGSCKLQMRGLYCQIYSTLLHVLLTQNHQCKCNHKKAYYFQLLSSYNHIILTSSQKNVREQM